MQLPLAEFIRRLRRHFLPPHFVKIRRYGCWPTAGASHDWRGRGPG